MFVEHKEALEATEPAKTMKLSEAIRIGAKLRPQGKGHAFKNGMSCVWGAAWEGLGNQYDETMGYTRIACELTHLRGRIGLGKTSLAMMNDHGQTREAIADWLESQGY